MNLQSRMGACWIFSSTIFTVLLLAAAAESYAFTLTNREVNEVSLEILEPGSDELIFVTVEPGQALEGVCEEGCSITLESGDRGEFDGSETIDVEDGHLVILD